MGKGRGEVVGSWEHPGVSHRCHQRDGVTAWTWLEEGVFREGRSAVFQARFHSR